MQTENKPKKIGGFYGIFRLASVNTLAVLL